MQILTTKEVAAGVLKNWDKLGAVTGKKTCLYEYQDGGGCAIGVNLTPETLKRVVGRGLNSASVTSLKVDSIVDFNGGDVYVIQYLHDAALNDTDYLGTLRMFCEMLAHGECV